MLAFDVTAQPTYKVFSVFFKDYKDEKYSLVTKLDKSMDLNEIHFNDEIENILDVRSNI